MSLNPTKRFSSRVDNYARYRPGYPVEIVEIMKRECGLLPEHVIADIASGTGIFSRLLLESGNRVFAIEPNAQMRAEGDKFLAQYKNIASINGTAEATTLYAHTVDFVTAAQAAHWFDPRKANAEFKRILVPKGWLVLVWNERELHSAFARDYENLLATYGTDYAKVRHRGSATDSTIADLFAPIAFRESILASGQEFDYEGLEGRLLSSSYAPEPGHPGHAHMLQALRELFDRHQHGGQVKIQYATKVYFGQLA